MYIVNVKNCQQGSLCSFSYSTPFNINKVTGTGSTGNTVFSVGIKP